MKKLILILCAALALPGLSHAADVKVSAMTPLTSGLTSNSLVSFSYISGGATNTRSIRLGTLLEQATAMGNFYNAYSSDGSSQQPTGARPQSKLGLLGGDAAALSSLPSSGHDIWHKGIQDPQAYVALWWVSYTNGGAAQFTNEIRRWETNGMFYAITNQGVQPWVLIDAAWSKPARSGGNYDVNTTLFPDGLPAFINYAHSHGFKVELGVYYVHELTNDFRIGVLGNYDSTTNATDIKVAATTPLTISKDIIYLYGTGADSLRVADYIDLVGSAGLAGNNLESMHQWAWYVKYPNGFDSSDYTLSPKRMGLSWFNGASYKFYPDIPLHVQVVNYDQPIGAGTLGTQISRGAYHMRLNQTNGAYASGRGHFTAIGPISSYASQADSDISWQASLTSGAMTAAILQFHETATQAFYNTATNTAMLSVWYDKDYHPVWRKSDDGRNSVWIKPLSGGRYAVAIFNESTTNRSHTINWSDFNPPRDWHPIQTPPAYVNTNVAYECWDVWQSANLGTTYDAITRTVNASNQLFFIASPRTDFAHRLGGNSFDGNQNHSGVMLVSNSIVSRGSSAGLFLYPRTGVQDDVLLYRDTANAIFKLSWAAAGNANMLTISNIFGPTYMDIDDPYTMEVGNGGRWQFDGTFKITTTAPASASATGTAGTIAWDASFFYVCTAANTWKRVAIATW